MKIVVYIWLMLFSVNTAWAQTVKKKEERLFLGSSVSQPFKFFLFSNDTLKVIEPNNYQEGTPEYLLFAFLSAPDTVAMRQLFYQLPPEMYMQEDYFNKMNLYRTSPTVNFYVLESRLEFTSSIGHHAIVKFLNHNELFPKVIASFQHFSKIDGKWFVSLPEANSELGLMLMQLNSESLANLLEKKKTGISPIDNFIELVWKSGVVSLDILSDTFDDWIENKQANETFRNYFMDLEHSPFIR